MKRPHAHLCNECGRLHFCACPDGWTVAYVPCGIDAECREVAGEIPEGF